MWVMPWLVRSSGGQTRLATQSKPLACGTSGGTFVPASGNIGAHELFVQIIDAWKDPDDDPGRELIAVLLQGSVTLSDHAASAHEQFILDQPINDAYRARLTKRITAVRRQLYPHQLHAAEIDGHMLLRAATGTGKTEGGLL